MKAVIRRARQTVSHLLFERRYRVDTSGRTDLDRFNLQAEDRVYYVPANWMTLKQVLNRWDIGPDDVFIDLGSGKGRMVLEAARYPFGRVIGVEVAGPLHRTAQDNVARTRMPRKCENIELVQADVLGYELPDDVTVVFLNNPFRGAVFATAAEKILASYAPLMDRAPPPHSGGCRARSRAAAADGS